MTVELIAGPSGAGKTTYIMQALVKSVKENPNKTHLLIVPEQYTLQTQKALCEISEGGVVMDIDILSFKRLSFRVFKELGLDDVNILEDTGKNLILRKIILENRESRLVLKDRGLNMSYIDEVKSLISELMQYRVSPGDLAEIKDSGEISDLLCAKLSDINLLYSEFEKYLNENTSCAEKILERFFEVMGESVILKDSVIAFDGFTGFTPIQNAIVSRLFSMSDKLYFTATMDEEAFKSLRILQSDLFYMSKSFFFELTRMATEKHTDVKKVFIDGKYGRFKDGLPEVKISSLRSPKEELRFAASKIRELVMAGERYKSIAILAGNLDVYTPYIDEIFSEYDIPVFTDKSETIGYHPFIGLLQSLSELISGNFKGKTYISFAKNPLVPVEKQDADELENYILATGVRGKKAFGCDFKYKTKTFDENRLFKINETRRHLSDLLKPLSEKYTPKRTFLIGEINRDLYAFIDSLDVEKALFLREEAYVFSLFIDTIEKLETFIANESVSFPDYMEILFSGLSTGKIGSLPESCDMVIFGDTVRTRLDDVDTLFIIGANEGILPPVSGGGGIFSDNDRRILKDMDLALAPGEMERNFAGIFYMYLCYTKPKKRLFTSFARTSNASEELRPSFILDEISNFYGLSGWTETNVPAVNTISAAKARLAELLREYVAEGAGEYVKPSGDEPGGADENVNASEDGQGEDAESFVYELSCLYRYFYDHDRESLEKIKRSLFVKDAATGISADILRAIDNNVISASVSRLERYASCSYAYYLQYILNLREREIFGMDNMDTGNIFHDSIYNYCVLLKEAGISLDKVDEDTRKSMLKKALDMAYEPFLRSGAYERAYDKYIKGRILRTMELTAEILGFQVKKGKFVPEYYETSLKDISDPKDLKLDLSNGSLLYLNGKIDRIDLARSADSVYIKVIDYKSGNKSFDLSLARGGIQIQLLYYLNAQTKAILRKNPDKNVVPAGIFYYHVDDPVIKKDEISDRDEIRGDIIKELRPSGIVCDNVEAISFFDEDLAEALKGKLSYYSDVIRVNSKKDGEFGAHSQIMSEEDLNFVLKKTESLVKETAEKIAEGKISKNPYRCGDSTPCDFCGYHSICEFDRAIFNDSYREIETIGSVNEWRAKDGV